MSKEYDPHGSLRALPNSVLSLSLAPADPHILLLPLSLGIYSLCIPKGLKSGFQVYRPSPCRTSVLKKSNFAPRSNGLSHLSQKNPLRVYRLSPQEHTYLKFFVEIQGVPII